MSNAVAYLLMRRYGWTAAEVATIPAHLLPLLLGAE